MTQRSRNGLALGTLAAVVLIAVGWRALHPGERPTVRELSGATITMLDVAGRKAEIEFIHPSSGRRMRLQGGVSPLCEIFINNRPAHLSDLRVGDQVRVRGTIQQGYTGATVEARWVNATRTAEHPTPTSGPATGHTP